ncbi:MAG: disulfide bond formation protein B [Rhodoplanes sp.]
MSRLYPLAAAANVRALVLILAGGFAVQLITGELPCPLCVMQRIALMLCALGPLHILLSARDGALTARAAAVGNGMAIVAALLGAAAFGRQVFLHILPGDPGFGAPVLGLHLYTWGLIAFACPIAASGVMLIATAWLEEEPATWGGLARWTVIALAAIVIANLFSVIAEAGLHWGLPESPEDYLMFK